MPAQSPIEKSFWETAKPLIPELQQEVWIDNYRVDFLLPSKKTIIELYGYEYHKSKEKITKDAKRERYLQKLGYKIIRFTGSEIYKDVNKCVNEVLELEEIKPNNNLNLINPLENWEIKVNKPKNKIPAQQKMNFRQKTIITSMTIMALCCICTTISIIISNFGR